MIHAGKKEREIMGGFDDERKRLIVKICRYYYMEGKNQQEIADRLHISRPKVSRLLSQAREEGIVNISIKNPFIEEQSYESALVEHFGIKEAIVVNTDEKNTMEVMRRLGNAGAVYLESVLKDKDTVGVMAGKAMWALTEEMEYFPRKNLCFVPLVGGWGNEGNYWNSNMNVRELGEKLKSTYYLLNAPAFVASKETRNMLLNEPEIMQVIDIAKKADIALIGIGQVSDNSGIVKSGSFRMEDIEEVKKYGAVANICTSFIDKNGDCIKYFGNDKTLGLTVDEIRKIPQVIAIANGTDKVEAIHATLLGKWIDILITDISTAKAVLEIGKQSK